jgi:fructose-specific phosphotransferase system component IIB
MKRKITQTDIKSAIETMATDDIKLKEESYNLIFLKTSNGIVKIKTSLSLAEWKKAHQLKPKQQNKKKRK